MKKKKILSILLTCSLTCSVTLASGVLSPVMNEEGSRVSAASKKTTTTRKGWFTNRYGRKKYYVKGTYVTGLRKIRKNTYYFNKKGIMQTGIVKVKKTTYYLDEKGHLEAYKVRSAYYNANGRKMSKTAASEFETLQTAKSIIKQITNSSMSNSEKLKKAFDWVISKPYVTRRVFQPSDGWTSLHANDHFLLGGGNCFADGCAFAYLAKAIGCKNVYVCVDSDGRGGSGHCWAEVNGLVYDPLFAEAKSYSGNYGVSYGTYILHPITRVKLS